MSKTDWASWVQAMGSLLALCVAVGVVWWQRFDERKQAKAVQLALAEVAADSVLTHNRRTLGILDGISLRWSQIKDRTFLDKIPAAFSEKINAINIPTDEQLSHMAAVWPQQVRALATARSLIRIAADAMAQVAGGVQSGKTVAASDIDDVMSMLAIANDALKAAHFGIRPEYRPHGPSI